MYDFFAANARSVQPFKTVFGEAGTSAAERWSNAGFWDMLSAVDARRGCNIMIYFSAFMLRRVRIHRFGFRLNLAELITKPPFELDLM